MNTATLTPPAMNTIHESPYVLALEDQQTGCWKIFARTRPEGPWTPLSSESASMAWQWVCGQLLGELVALEKKA